MDRLKNKIALITGGASGMGETHSRLFIEEGAQVFITDLNEEKGQALADELGDQAFFIKQDVSSEEDWQKLAEELEQKVDRLDILVNNAGISPVLTVEEASLEDYMRVVGINQVSCFLGMKYMLAFLKKSDSGSIINISSINGLTGGSIGYTDTKFAVRGMTKAAAKELAQYGIRVNSVHPGIIETPMVKTSEAYDQIQSMASMLPVKRMGQAEEVSQMVLYLASDDSSYSTGAEFVVDGGMTS